MMLDPDNLLGPQFLSKYFIISILSLIIKILKAEKATLSIFIHLPGVVGASH